MPGKTELCRTDDDIRYFCGMLDGLAFFPEDKVQGGMAHLREHTPGRMEELVESYDSRYVTGTFRRARAPPTPLRVQNISLHPPRVNFSVTSVKFMIFHLYLICNTCDIYM